MSRPINFILNSGLERVGNNCFRDWLIAHIKYVQLINVSPRVNNISIMPGADQTLPPWDKRIETIEDAKSLFNYPKELLANNQQFSTCPIETIFDATRILAYRQNFETLLIANEWNALEELIPPLLTQASTVLGGRACAFILLRDPLNWLASFYRRRANITPYNIKDFSEYPVKELNWPQDLYLSHFRKWKNYITPTENIMSISYAKFVSDYDYRLNILKFAHIDVADQTNHLKAEKNLNTKVSAGVDQQSGGSSWDKLSYQGRAKEMDILTRYKHLGPIKDKIYPELFSISWDYFDLPIKYTDL